MQDGRLLNIYHLPLISRQQHSNKTNVIPPASVKLFERLFFFFRGHREKTRIPGCGEYSVDNWILRVLGAHQKHVLCKIKHKAKKKKWVRVSRESVRSAFSIRAHIKENTTHAARRSVCQCR